MPVTATGIDSLDRSVHHANEWLSHLTDELGEDRRTAFRAMRAFLHALRDQITVEEGADLAAQLPLLWRGVFYEGWRPGHHEQRMRDPQAFLARVAQEGQLTGITEASHAVEACMRVLRSHVTEGEIDDVLAVLPDQLSDLLVATG